MKNLFYSVLGFVALFISQFGYAQIGTDGLAYPRPNPSNYIQAADYAFQHINRNEI